MIVQPRPKAAHWSCEAYRRLVASMDCAHCGKAGPLQCAHTDASKGMALKTDDRQSFPLCAPTYGRPGCHVVIGSSGYFRKDQRRTLETNYARKTREQIRNQGLWLPSWPQYEEQE